MLHKYSQIRLRILKICLNNSFISIQAEIEIRKYSEIRLAMEFIDFNPGLSLGKHPEWKLGDSSEVVSDTEQPARISALDTSRRTQTKTQTKTDTHKDRQNTHTYNAHRLKKFIHINNTYPITYQKLVCLHLLITLKYPIYSHLPKKLV